MLERELRDLGHVPRWSILRRQSQQSVVEHSWFVAMYAKELAQYLDWLGSMSALLGYALVHDLDEVWTADIPGPAKRLLTNGSGERIKAQLAARVRQIFPDHVEAYLCEDSDIKAIVRCADRLDAVLYLCDEHQLGNRSVGEISDPGSPLGANYVRLRTAWNALPWTDQRRFQALLREGVSRDDIIQLAWDEVVVPAMARAQSGVSRILVDAST